MPAEATWYHAAQDSVSRAEGNSAVGLVAYITGTDLKDDRTGNWCTRNHEGDVLAWGSVAPASAAAWLTDPECLGRTWNAVEASETRINSRVAEHLNVAGKNGFTDDQHIACAHEIAGEISKRYGVLVTWGVHKPTDHGDDRNWHYHFGWNERKVEGEKFGAKVRELSGRRDVVQAEIVAVRKLVADVLNKHLQANGFDERVSHLSYRARGIDKEATRHRGHKANQLELKGERTEVGDHNREVEKRNAERRAAAERVLKIESEIVYIESRRRKHAMDHDAATTEYANRQQRGMDAQVGNQQNGLHDLEKLSEERRRLFAQVEIDKQEGARLQKDLLDGRTADADITDARERFLLAAGERFDIRRPEASLSEVVGLEGARAKREHNMLTRQAAMETNNDKKQDILLRRDIMYADYMAITSERLVGISVATGGANRRHELDENEKPIPTQDEQYRAQAEYWAEQGTKLREEREKLAELMTKKAIDQSANQKDMADVNRSVGLDPGHMEPGRYRPLDHHLERVKGVEGNAEKLRVAGVDVVGVQAGSDTATSRPIQAADESRPAETRAPTPLEAHETKWEQFKQTDEWREMSDAKREARQKLHDNYSEVLADRESQKSNVEEGVAHDRHVSGSRMSF